MKKVLSAVCCTAMLLGFCTAAMAGDVQTRGRIEIPYMGMGPLTLPNNHTAYAGMTVSNPNNQALSFFIQFYDDSGAAMVRSPVSGEHTLNPRASTVVITSSLLTDDCASGTLVWWSEGDREPCAMVYFNQVDESGNWTLLSTIMINN